MDTLTNTFNWFNKAVPEPTKRNVSVQIGVHFEEVSEFIEALLEHAPKELTNNLQHSFYAVKDLATLLKSGEYLFDNKLVGSTDALDAVVDQTVTAIGVAYMCGWDMLGAVKEVNRSNYSKFDSNGNAVFNANGKIVKSESYTPPNLTPYIKSY